MIAARILTAYYFIHFLIVFPLLGLIETPKPLPNSISESVLKKGKAAAAVLLALGLGALTLLGSGSAAFAAGDAPHPPRIKWSFAGGFGKFDRAQLQRGFKVYKEVCQTCHGLSLVSFRNLADPGGPGFTPAQAAAIAAEYKIQDGPNDQGEMFERDGRARPIAFRRPSTWKNEQQARILYNGTVPPDMSVLAKARSYERGFPLFLIDALPFFQYQEHGVDYVTALLKGYKDPPPRASSFRPAATTTNTSPGTRLRCRRRSPTAASNTPTAARRRSISMSKDVAAFMMWAAEPHLEARKRIGFQVMIFLLVLTGLIYFTKKKIWAEVH